MKTRIVLIGPMASGKSTTGKILSESLGFDFIDSDSLIEQKEGLSVAEIFEKKGEGYFREQEERLLAQIVLRPNIVIAAGGGMVKSAQNRIILKSCFNVYLKISVETQLARTEGDLSRPLINTADRKAKLVQLQQEREVLYQELADMLIDSNALSPEEIAKSIQQKL